MRAVLALALIPGLVGAAPHHAHQPHARTRGFVISLPVIPPDSLQGDSAKVEAYADSVVQRFFRAANTAPVITIPTAHVEFFSDAPPARPTSRSAE